MKIAPALLCFLLSAASFGKTTIVTSPGATRLQAFAAREVRRYLYLRTGELATIIESDAAPPEDNSILIALAPKSAGLGPEQYTLEIAPKTSRILGGDDMGVLYGAYRFAEHLGVRFYLHGDVIPDARLAALPEVRETGKPLFETRGLQPFHDFPEGPDWWSREDYLAYIGQLPKLRFNFIGFHNYPPGEVGPEPGVWIGRTSELDGAGRVQASYPAQWANTARQGAWGYAPMKTSEFAAGASLLFAADVHGAPLPESPEQCNARFEEAGDLLHSAFSFARLLGVKTCIGTETPLSVPKTVAARGESTTTRDFYRGIFTRISKRYPVDYYWLWTPEDWTWQGNKPEQFAATQRDIEAALGALEDLGHPFTLATSGWVLGPRDDRGALDRILPKSSPVSTINRKVGHSPDEPMFANITGRPKWVIPWLENDPNLTAPQPWVGRMRYDAADARRLGCTGLLGIHWRTQSIAANISALASAAWDQSWIPPTFDMKPIPPGTAKEDLASDEKGNNHPLRNRTMPVADFYEDYARAQFGAEVGHEVGAILARVDGTNLPEPSDWVKGPGGIRVNRKPWSEVRRQYAFVDELARLRDRVHGAGNQERFEIMLDSFRAMSVMAQAGCLRGQIDIKMDQGKKSRRWAKKALTERMELARVWEQLLTYEISAAGTPGEWGTIVNLEQHNRRFLKFVNLYDEALRTASKKPLPEGAEPRMAYTGRARLFLPTVRTAARKGEAVELTAIALNPAPLAGVTLHWRPLGSTGPFQPVRFQHAGRAVYRSTLPELAEDLEYYVEAETDAGGKMVWPPTAPALNQTIVALW